MNKEIGLIVDIRLVILSLYTRVISHANVILNIGLYQHYLSTFCASVPIISIRKIRNHLKGMAVLVY